MDNLIFRWNRHTVSAETMMEWPWKHSGGDDHKRCENCGVNTELTVKWEGKGAKKGREKLNPSRPLGGSNLGLLGKKMSANFTNQGGVLTSGGEEWSWFQRSTLQQLENTSQCTCHGPAKLLDRKKNLLLHNITLIIRQSIQLSRADPVITNL